MEMQHDLYSKSLVLVLVMDMMRKVVHVARHMPEGLYDRLTLN
jgi:hypothetical protein